MGQEAELRIDEEKEKKWVCQKRTELWLEPADGPFLLEIVISAAAHLVWYVTNWYDILVTDNEYSVRNSIYYEVVGDP